MVAKRRFSDDDGASASIAKPLTDSDMAESDPTSVKRQKKKQDATDTNNGASGKAKAPLTDAMRAKIKANPGQKERGLRKKALKKSTVELELKVDEYYKKSGFDRMTLRHSQAALLWCVSDGRNPNEWLFLKNMSLINKYMTIVIDGLTVDLYTKYGTNCPNLVNLNLMMGLLFPPSSQTNQRPINHKNKSKVFNKASAVTNTTGESTNVAQPDSSSVKEEISSSTAETHTATEDASTSATETTSTTTTTTTTAATVSNNKVARISKEKAIMEDYASEVLNSYFYAGIPAMRRKKLEAEKKFLEDKARRESGEAKKSTELPPNSHYILTREELTMNQFPSWYPGWTGEMLTPGAILPDMKGYQGTHKDHVPTKAELVQDGETRNKRIGRDVDFETPVVDDVERTCILPVFSIDCEMCETKSGPALTRVSIVNEAAEVVMDELVMPDEPITNYLTQFSGMTRELLKGVTTTVLDVQTRIRSLIPANAILLGHSLENDLRAMKLVHRRVIDTSLLYPHPGGNGLKQGLKTLCRTHLDRSIQEGVGGHDSIEDARACLALYALKMKKGPRFGINTRTQVSESICRRLTRSKKTSVLIDKLELIKKHTDANVINHRNDQQAVAAMLKQCQRDVNFHYIRLFAVSDFVKSFHTEETKLLEATNSVTRREISAIPTTKNSTDIVYQTESVGSIEEATQGTLNTTEESTGKVKTEVRNGTTGEQAIVDDASESSQEMTSKWTVEVSPALREGSMCLTKEEYTEQMEEVLTQLDGRIGKLIAAMPKNAVVNVIAGPGVLPESEKANKHQLFSARNGFMFMKVISGNGEAGAREPMEEDK